MSYLTTVFPFGLNHSAKVSPNTSCFLYVPDRDVWFCFIMMIFFFFFKVLLQNETIQGFMKDYRCLSLNTPASPPLCPCSFWDWGGGKNPGDHSFCSCTCLVVRLSRFTSWIYNLQLEGRPFTRPLWQRGSSCGDFTGSSCKEKKMLKAGVGGSLLTPWTS